MTRHQNHSTASRCAKIEDAIERLTDLLGTNATVRSPKDADAPILAPFVRRALFEWMAEIGVSNDLAKAGLKPRTNALLYGPPGCGKTTFAHHFAARLGLPMVVVGAENIFSCWMGASENAVADLFNGLSKADTPCVLFIDELEAIGGSRGANTTGGADNARTSTLTVLLRKVEEYNGGYLLAATNRQDDIDPALWRRFNMQIGIDLPGSEERFAIIRRYLSPFSLPDDDIDVITSCTDGASPSLIRELMEGIKRALIVRPRLNLPLDDAESMFRSIVSSTRPPPEMIIPELWQAQADMSAFKGLTWPPSRVDAI